MPRRRGGEDGFRGYTGLTYPWGFPMTSQWLMCVALGVQCVAAFGLAEAEDPVIKAGYVTEMRSAHEFALNQQVVETDSATEYRLLNGKEAESELLAQHALQVGAYLQVEGTHESGSHRLHA